MLAMTGTLRPAFPFPRRLLSYQSVRVTSTRRVVWIPPIGSFLVDWDPAMIRVHIAGHTQRDIDELMRQLDAEAGRCDAPVQIVWSN